MKITSKLWIALGILVLFSPLGLILPDRFKAGSAWGEWGVDEMKELVGYVPAGLKKLGNLWNAPLPDYAFQGWEEKGLTHLSFAYIFSAILGAALIALVVWLMGKILIKQNK